MTWPTISLGARFDKTAYTWTEIGDYCERIQIRTGRQRFLDRWQAGTLDVELANDDRRFDPLNLSGPYVSGGATQVTPQVQLLATATLGGVDRYLQLGFVDRWDTTPMFPGDAICRVSSTDGFKQLARYDISATGAGGYNVGTTMIQVAPTGAASTYLSTAGIDTSGQQPTTDVYNPTGKSLSLLQALADTDRGDLYMRPQVVAGNVKSTIQFKRYSRRQTATSGATWSDDPGVGEFLYESVSPLGTNDDTFVTQVTGQRSGGTAYVASSSTALTANLSVPVDRSNTSLLCTEPDVATWAEGVLSRFSSFETGFARMVVDPAAQEDATLWAEVLDTAIGDRITIVHNPPGGGTAISRDHFVEGIQHDIALPAADGNRGRGWVTTFLLSDATPFFTDVLILDDATRGKLDTGRLGF